MKYHLSLYDEEFDPELGIEFKDYEETETAFVMVEIEVDVKTARA